MLSDRTIFINRELSWLQFNERVLQEASNPSTPLIERLKFLGIYSNNQDEFFRVRVGTLNRMAKYNTESPYEYVGENPKKILSKIYDSVNNLKNKFNHYYIEILTALERENIFILNENQLSNEQGVFIKKYFHNHVRPNIFPVLLDNINNFSLLKDHAIYLAVAMSNKTKKSNASIALIEISTDNLERFIQLPTSENKEYVMIVDDVIRYCLKEIFAIFDFDCFKAYTIKFTRDAELDLDNDISKSFIEILSDSVEKRKQGNPVRFIYDRTMPDIILKKLMKKLQISDYDHVVEGGRYHNFKDFMNFPVIGGQDLKFNAVEPIVNKSLNKHVSIFNAIKENDILLHFPYHSFQSIIDFIREASIDPKVRSISMTIYRLARNSNVINALINAARNGKKVSVYMEIQARFDEEANINWASRLHEAGVKVYQTVPGLKVHSKIILISRKEKDKNVLYANVATGNYNESTSKVYSDISLLTCDPRITNEVERVFDMFEHSFKNFKFNHLWISPNFLRDKFTRFINQEIKNAKEGKRAEVILKLNNLVDPDMVKKLIQASQNGVRIQLIIRGICTLIPGMIGKTENITAVSIVDKYLEHSRVYIFHNGGDEKMFISSADLMTRNLERRIEVTCPIFDPELKREIKDIINIQLSDNTKARNLSNNQLLKRKINDKIYRAQEDTYKYLQNI
ncbi:MAG: polyphosphate kinase 1 [Bacteroidota bacterium]